MLPRAVAATMKATSLYINLIDWDTRHNMLHPTYQILIYIGMSANSNTGCNIEEKHTKIMYVFYNYFFSQVPLNGIFLGNTSHLVGQRSLLRSITSYFSFY